MVQHSFWCRFFSPLAIVCAFNVLHAEDQGAGKEAEKEKKSTPAAAAPADSLVRVSPDNAIWLDQKRKVVLVDGTIVLRDGLLEMFACPKGTKEHESIVAVNAKPQFVHAALVAIGADPGRPVSYDPEYKAATGPTVEVSVSWKDSEGKEHKVRAQEWIFDIKMMKPMSYSWVFAGSSVHIDEETGRRTYLADGGDFICVSNFSSAMLDLPVESSDSNSGLTFKAYTEKIPPLGTPVRLELKPVLAAKKKEPAKTERGSLPKS